MKAAPHGTLVGALVLLLPGVALAQAGKKPASALKCGSLI